MCQVLVSVMWLEWNVKFNTMWYGFSKVLQNSIELRLAHLSRVLTRRGLKKRPRTSWQLGISMRNTILIFAFYVHVSWDCQSGNVCKQINIVEPCPSSGVALPWPNSSTPLPRWSDHKHSTLSPTHNLPTPIVHTQEVIVLWLPYSYFQANYKIQSSVINVARKEAVKAVAAIIYTGSVLSPCL